MDTNTVGTVDCKQCMACYNDALHTVFNCVSYWRSSLCLSAWEKNRIAYALLTERNT